MKTNQQIFRNLDMLWADFLVPGRVQPISAIVGTLKWRSDYEALKDMQNKGIKPSEFTPSMDRAVTYSAAGWALASFQQRDPLATDYIAWIAAQPDQERVVRIEHQVRHSSIHRKLRLQFPLQSLSHCYGEEFF